MRLYVIRKGHWLFLERLLKRSALRLRKGAVEGKSCSQLLNPVVSIGICLKLRIPHMPTSGSYLTLSHNVLPPTISRRPLAELKKVSRFVQVLIKKLKANLYFRQSA